MDNIKQIVSQHLLFQNCPPSLLQQLATMAEYCYFSPLDVIKSYDERPKLFIIVSGEAEVHTKDANSDLLLRTLRAGDAFGVANLFGHNPTVTRVVATKSTTVICLSEDAMRHAVMTDGDFAMRYITFLSDRICFLNRRITTLSAGCAERRLAAWLDTVVPEDATSYILTVPLNRLSDMLGLGRASLYRAFDELTNLAYLKRSGKTVLFLDRVAMRDHYGLR